MLSPSAVGGERLYQIERQNSVDARCERIVVLFPIWWALGTTSAVHLTY